VLALEIQAANNAAGEAAAFVPPKIGPRVSAAQVEPSNTEAMAMLEASAQVKRAPPAVVASEIQFAFALADVTGLATNQPVPGSKTRA
jgi:hypothetical protein